VTNPLNSFTTNFGRFYAHPSSGVPKTGTALTRMNPEVLFDPYDPFAPKPSITNITGMLDKKFLPPYYAKLVAEYAISHIDSLAATVAKFGSDVAVGTLKAVPNQSNPAAAIGDEVHAWIDALLKHEPAPSLTSLTATNMAAQFANFIEITKPEILASEYTVWSYTHGYAGTGDLMWRFPVDLVSPQGVVIPAGVWIVDNKTGNQVHPEVAMQTSAAAHADVILDGDGNESEMIKSDFQGVLHIRPRSVKLYQLNKTEEAFDAFLACKRLFDWKRFDAELVLSEPFKTEIVKAA
jgi:hypothetical protein